MSKNEPTTAVTYRTATRADVPALVTSRAADVAWGPADPRTASYLAGDHHPGQALRPRTMYVGLAGETFVGYIAGHLTRRYECDGELQYLWVAPPARRNGVATRLLRLLAGWFAEQGAKRICVDVTPDNTVARSFYTRHGAEALNPNWLVWTSVVAAFELP